MKVSLTQPNSTSELAGLADNADAVAASSTTNKIPFLARLSLFNGSTWDRMRGDTTGLWGIIRDAAGNARGLNIDANGALAATVTNATASNFKVDLSGTGANTTAIKVDGSAVTQPVSMATNTPVGNVAHDAADSGNPIKVGGRARTSEISQISNDDRSDFITDTVGKQIVLPYANPENFVKGVTGAITDTTSTSTIAAQGAGIRTYITSILVTNSHASTGTFVKILDGSTIIWEGYAAPGGGGFAQSFPTPLRGTANTAVNTQCVTTGANVIASIAGYKGV